MYRVNMAFKRVLISIFIVLPMCLADDRPIVNTKLGVIKGLLIKAPFKEREYTVNRYAGLRYAKPPVGELRFKRPEPYGSFNSPLDASEFTSACPQNNVMNIGEDSINEDCLSLNVYVPTHKSEDAKGYAVMVFVHGGGFNMGGSSVYPGEVLSAVGKVIVVVINYRLGLLGFANTGDGHINGNMGLWDQRMAFQWVQDNIASFGGNPSKVTLFGESAGAVSVTMHGMYPPNKGLFRSIIAESGSPTMPFQMKKDNIASLSFIAETLGCSTENTDAVVTCLKQIETENLMSTFAELSKDPANQIKLQLMPTIDGDFIKQEPLEVYTEARHGSKEQIDFFRSINLLNGINNAEGTMFLMMLGQVDGETIVVSQEEMRTTHIPNMFAAFMNPTGRPVPEALLSLVAAEYWSNDPSNAREMYIKMFGDIFFNMPGRELLDVHVNSSDSNTWFYSFDAITDLHLIPQPSWVKGANHADELSSVFGYCLSSLGPMLNLTDYKPPEWELDMSERIMTYWSNFAKFDDPNGMNGGSGMWPKMTMDSKQLIVFNKEDSIGKNLYSKEVNFWREIVPLVWDAVERSPFSSKSTETCEADGNCG